MIGILSLQGSISEHASVLNKIGVSNKAVLNQNDLKGPVGLIIPGDESTAIKKLMAYNHLFPAIKKLIQEGLPTFDTCAGIVLLSQPESFDTLKVTVSVMALAASSRALRKIFILTLWPILFTLYLSGHLI